MPHDPRGTHQALPLANAFYYEAVPAEEHVYDGYVPGFRTVKTDDAQTLAAPQAFVFNGREDASTIPSTAHVSVYGDATEQNAVQNPAEFTAPATIVAAHTPVSRPCTIRKRGGRFVEQVSASQMPAGIRNLVPDPSTGLYFSSYAHAKAACRRPTQRTPADDRPLPSTDAEKQEIVRRLRQAILNTTDTKDKQGIAYRKRWLEGASYWPPYVERVTWSILVFPPGFLRYYLY